MASLYIAAYRFEGIFQIGISREVTLFVPVLTQLFELRATVRVNSTCGQLSKNRAIECLRNPLPNA